MDDLNNLTRISHFVQIAAIVLVLLGGILQASKFFLDKKIDNLKTKISKEEKLKVDETVTILKKDLEKQTTETEELKTDVLAKEEKIIQLEARVNIVNSIDIHVYLDEYTPPQIPTEKETSAGLQSAVAFFTLDNTRIRFVTDFQFSVQQIEPKIKRGFFIYKPEEPTQILGKEINYLNQFDKFAYNFSGFINPLGFNPANKNHKLTIIIFLNGISLLEIDNVLMQNGQLYSGDLIIDIKEVFSDIEKKYQDKINN